MDKLLICLLFFAFTVSAQTKPVAKKPGDKKTAAKKDTVKKEEPKVVEMKIPRTFMVYTRKMKGQKTKLCVNLVSKDTVLNYCIPDSITKDPEVYKIIFEERKGDTTYVLVYVDGFSKPDAGQDDGRCGAGHETKLFFTRWNTKTNQAKWQNKTITSCLRGTTNMTKEPIDDWDKASVLTINYHRASTFTELKFDPQHPELGLQTNKEGGD